MKKFKSDKDITSALLKKKDKGGCVFLPVGEYPIYSPILLNTPSTRLLGEVWAYNLDPNGVFETRYGTKLKLCGKDHAAISIGDSDLPAGAMISDIGIQGDIVGMDTRALFDVSSPFSSAGLYFGNERVDQGDFSKISCCGLAVGISMAQNSEIDACDFRKINVDGCCVGIYFAPRASYYARFNRCIVADNPSFGFYADCSRATMHNMDITETHFVRNSGANHIKSEEPAAVLLKNVSRSTFRDNLVDDPGTFWYFEPTATDNADKTVYKHPAIGLHLIGNENRIFNNIFTNSSRESILIEGKGNIMMGNIVDGDIIICGEGNTVNGLSFSTPGARLVLKGSAAASSTIIGVENDRIVKCTD